MQKNRIIPQMFDVRPVDETGDLDWEKINAIGRNDALDRSLAESGYPLLPLLEKKLEEKPNVSFEYDGRGATAYILGVPVESNMAPILHDPNFRIDDCAAILDKWHQVKNSGREQGRQENESAGNVHSEVAGNENLFGQEKMRENGYLSQVDQRRVEWKKYSEQRLAEEANILAEHEQRRQEYQARQFLVEEQQRQRIELEKLKYQEDLKKNAEIQRAAWELKQAEMQAEKKRREEELILKLEIDKRRLQKKQRDLLAIQNLNKEKEAEILAEKARIDDQRKAEVRRRVLEQQDQLKRNAEQQREQLAAYEEKVRIEKESHLLEQEQAHRESRRLAAEQSKPQKIKKHQTKHTDWFVHLQGKNKGKSSSGESIKRDFSWRELLSPRKFSFQFDSRKSLLMFLIVAVILSLGVGGVSYASKGFGLRAKVLGQSADGLDDLTAAMSDMAHQNFEGGAEQFSQALANFSQGSDELQSMGGAALDSTRFLPFTSKISSGKNAIEAGKHFAAAGQALNNVLQTAASLKNPIDPAATNNVSLLDVLKSAQTNIAVAKTELDSAQNNIDQISVDDLPQDKQSEFLTLKQELPSIRSGLDLFLNNSNILYELLGGNGPRKYLFLFQNNSEMRATGGFIGSYGLLDIQNGRVNKFFIDGIFDPDGQLKDKIVPPTPIQKISTNWSMHDSNWFPDFPLSAQKAINFYEKTGGPTADGVITLTPTVMQKLLEITGPIDMPDYGVTLDSSNFLELTQYEVEDNYDKTQNQPKKILSDLAPLLLDKLMSSRDLDTMSKTADALLEGLQEKQILFYSQNADIEKIISQQGWSGEILPASKDYVSVINTNINGFKTDAVIDESISHKAEIQADGSVVDTLTITRKHNGGNTPYDWLNKVNADYMRVYVPDGSKLLDVSGQTREVDSPPVDYDALGFQRDPDVQKEEDSTTIDPASGTRIYSESGKTVFANWTYVSPGETMTITYKYLLPFSLFKVSVGGQQVDSYSLVAQKQSGSLGSSFSSDVTYPADYSMEWNFPDDAQKSNDEVTSNGSLKTDLFEGMVFEKNQN